MALLGGSAVAVGLLAALTARAAQLGGGAWLPVLAPFALVVTVPLAALAWLHHGENTDERVQASGDPDQRPGSLVDRAWFGRGVPLARRNLFQDRRRVLLSIGGVAVALLLVLILGGIFAGAMRQLTSYIDRSGANLIVSQAGVTTMHMSASILRPDIADRVRETPGVAWAEPIRYTTGMVSSSTGQSASYVIGYQPTARHAGPSRLVAGRPPGPNEAVVDRQGADQLGVRVGNRVRVLGRPFMVVGLSTGGTNIANTTVFIPSRDFAHLRGSTQAYVLVGAHPGVDLGVLRARLEGIPPGVTVQTSGQFAASERRIVTDMSADLLRIMSGIGFGIALAVIALTLFNVTVSKTREYGVVKALGARPGRLVATVAAQAAWSVVLALATATALALLLAAVIGQVNPALAIWIAPGSVLRTGLGALLVGVVGAVLPIRRVLRVDPAASFRRPT
ncbi:MAG TPA: ABC transporter permease [Actinomycetes bacterium]|nr:ABC transporter permease [Actinomycetes bacterium]